MPRKFDILDVLSISTDMLLSERHMDAIYDLLNYMTGDDLYTHQLGRAATECKPVLLKRHPVLVDPKMVAAVDGLHKAFDRLREATKDASREEQAVAAKKIVTAWKTDLLAGKYGFECPETLMIAPLSEGEHEFIDPLSELAEKVPPDRIIVIGKP